MEKLIEHLPEIITAAAQSFLGILALMSVALSILAYFFFAKASEIVKVIIFVLLFLGVSGFGVAVFFASEYPEPIVPTTLSKEAKAILKEAALDPGGLVLFERFGAAVDLQSNGTSFLTSKVDHRLLVTWESALQELVDKGLLASQDQSGQVFEITKKGYDVAKSSN